MSTTGTIVYVVTSLTFAALVWVGVFGRGR